MNLIETPGEHNYGRYILKWSLARGIAQHIQVKELKYYHEKGYKKWSHDYELYDGSEMTRLPKNVEDKTFKERLIAAIYNPRIGNQSSHKNIWFSCKYSAIPTEHYNIPMILAESKLLEDIVEVYNNFEHYENLLDREMNIKEEIAFEDESALNLWRNKFISEYWCKAKLIESLNYHDYPPMQITRHGTQEKVRLEKGVSPYLGTYKLVGVEAIFGIVCVGSNGRKCLIHEGDTAYRLYLDDDSDPYGERLIIS